MRVFALVATALVASVAAGPSFGPDVDSDAQGARLERRGTLEKRGAAKVRRRSPEFDEPCGSRASSSTCSLDSVAFSSLAADLDRLGPA